MHGWWLSRDVLVVAVPAIALVALTFYVASRYVQPAPPDHLVMATGASGGAYQKYGEQYKEYLKQFGVDLELKQTQGAAENFALLRDGRVDVAFVQGGVAKPLADVNGEPPVVSLGALYYEAMWVFLRADQPQVDTLAGLAGRRLAIGAEGSGTRALALQLLQDSGIEGRSTKFLPQGGTEMLQALDAGEVDVVFQVAGVEAPIVSELLHRRDLKPMSLVHAAAYAKRNSNLTALTVPRGVVDIADDLPPRDLAVVATTANLLARNEVHPALMYLLLDTASEVNSGHARLSEAKTFPNPRAQDLPVAEEAQRYYKSGKPFLKAYLPYWAANFVDRMLILLIPIVGVLIPAIKFAPVLYTYRLKSRIRRWYAQLGAVESEMAGPLDAIRIDDCLARLDTIEAEIKAADMPSWLSDQIYLLRAAIDLVRERFGIRTPRRYPVFATIRAMARALERPPDRRKVSLRGANGLAHARSGATVDWRTPCCGGRHVLPRGALDARGRGACASRGGRSSAGSRRRRAQGDHRAARRLRVFGTDRRVGLRAPRGRTRHDPPRRAVRSHAPRAGTRARVAFGRSVRDAARLRGRRSRRGRPRADAAPGLHERCRARARALARSAAAVPAGGARNLQHRAVRRRRCDGDRGR